MSARGFWDDTECCRRATLGYLKFVLENKVFLLKRRNGEKHYEAMENISRIPDHAFTPKQMSYVDCVYEMVMKQMGFPSYVGQKSKYGINLRA